MAKATRIVIDTNIVRSIGAAPSQASQPLLDALAAAQTGKLRLIKTAELDAEWERHMPANGLFLEWQADMLSRGLVGRRELKTLVALKKRLRNVVPRPDHDAVIKDAHLAAAAIETEARVVSLDDKMRGHLSRASGGIDELREVMWANPSKADEEVPDWLGSGAQYDNDRTLGARQYSG